MLVNFVKLFINQSGKIFDGSGAANLHHIISAKGITAQNLIIILAAFHPNDGDSEHN